jgi:Tfp pilus assembly protein PilF
LLEGSARKGEDHIRISAQLIDVATGTHRWAEHYDRTLEDVFAVQDDVVRTIVAILAAHVRQAETERLRAKPPNSWQAYDCYLQAVQALAAFSSTLNEAHIEEARRLLQQSLTIDPNYARSYAGLAVTDVSAWHNPAAEDFLKPAVLDRAHDFARKAVQLDRNLPLAHAALGWVLVYKHQHDASIAALEKSVALNPNYVDWRFGVALIRAGDAKRAIEVVHAYMRLDPFYVPFASFVLGYAHLMLKQYPQALCSYATTSPRRQAPAVASCSLQPLLEWATLRRPTRKWPRLCASSPNTAFPAFESLSRSSTRRTTTISLTGCAKRGCPSRYSLRHTTDDRPELINSQPSFAQLRKNLEDRDPGGQGRGRNLGTRACRRRIARMV